MYLPFYASACVRQVPRVTDFLQFIITLTLITSQTCIYRSDRHIYTKKIKKKKITYSTHIICADLWASHTELNKIRIYQNKFLKIRLKAYGEQNKCTAILSD